MEEAVTWMDMWVGANFHRAISAFKYSGKSKFWRLGDRGAKKLDHRILEVTEPEEHFFDLTEGHIFGGRVEVETYT